MDYKNKLNTILEDKSLEELYPGYDVILAVIYKGNFEVWLKRIVSLLEANNCIHIWSTEADEMILKADRRHGEDELFVLALIPKTENINIKNWPFLVSEPRGDADLVRLTDVSDNPSLDDIDDKFGYDGNMKRFGLRSLAQYERQWVKNAAWSEDFVKVQYIEYLRKQANGL